MDRPEKQPRAKKQRCTSVFKVSGHLPKELAFLVRHGVTHMDASVKDTETETLLRHKEEAAASWR